MVLEIFRIPYVRYCINTGYQKMRREAAAGERAHFKFRLHIVPGVMRERTGITPAPRRAAAMTRRMTAMPWQCLCHIGGRNILSPSWLANDK